MADLNELKFKKSFWGYKPAQVCQEIESISNDHKQARQEQLQKMADMEKELDQLRQELENTRRQTKEFKQQEHTIVDSLSRSQADAAAIEEKAWQESRNIINNALKEVEAQKYSLELLNQQYEAFRRDFMSILHRYSATLIDADKEKQEQIMNTPSRKKKERTIL